MPCTVRTKMSRRRRRSNANHLRHIRRFIQAGRVSFPKIVGGCSCAATRKRLQVIPCKILEHLSKNPAHLSRNPMTLEQDSYAFEKDFGVWSESAGSLG